MLCPVNRFLTKVEAKQPNLWPEASMNIDFSNPMLELLKVVAS